MAVGAAQDHRVGGLGGVDEGEVGDAAARRAGREGGRARLADDALRVLDDLDLDTVGQAAALLRPVQVPAYAHHRSPRPHDHFITDE